MVLWSAALPMAAKPFTIALRTGALLGLALASGRGQAQAAQPSLTIVVGKDAPAGFDRRRLEQRIAVYLNGIVAIAPAEADAAASSTSERKARFVAQLEWPQGTMTPLQGVVLDTEVSPPRRYDFEVSGAENWGEFERLVALKLWSVLRASMAQSAPQPKEPDRPEPVAGEGEEGATRAVVELGAGVLGRDGFEAPRAVGSFRFALALQRWAFGVTASLTLAETARAGTTSEAVEVTCAASLRYDLLRAQASPWILQIGSDFGLFVARVTGSRTAQERVAHAVSPLSSALVLVGYRLLDEGAATVLVGPTVDLLWNRSEIHAGGTPVYDSGRVRLRAELKLMLAF